MLICVRIANHRSIRESQQLSLEATTKPPSNQARRPVPHASKRSVLPVAAIFGPNAAGKSNVIDALNFMRSAVLDSHERWGPRGAIPREPFAFDEVSRDEPTEIEVEFAVADERFIYGFSCDDRAILEEWLFSHSSARRKMIFHREGRDVEFGPSVPGPKKVVKQILRSNSLLVSTAATLEFAPIMRVYDWFHRSLLIATDLNADVRLQASLARFRGCDDQEVLSLLRYADLGVSGMKFSDRKVPAELQERVRKVLEALEVDHSHFEDISLPPNVAVQHQYDGKTYDLPLWYESSGTDTWLSMLDPILRARDQGLTLVVDEIDARLHPHLVGKLVSLFQDETSNPHGAQLVFSCHDPFLLGKRAPSPLRKDQVWFAERSYDTGATSLYPLTDFKEVREDRDNLEVAYLLGRYGAVPFLDDRLLDLPRGREATVDE